jgi:hypothetical protein
MQRSRGTTIAGLARTGRTLAAAVALLSALLPGASARADAPPAAPPPAVELAALAAPGTLEVIPVDEIEPGLTGYGYTVFAGRDPERFEAEVVGVMRNAAPGG